MWRLTLGLLLPLFSPQVCLAWGEAGHATIAEIAGRYLSKKAKAHVRRLLGPRAHEPRSVVENEIKAGGRRASQDGGVRLAWLLNAAFK